MWIRDFPRACTRGYVRGLSRRACAGRATAHAGASGFAFPIGSPLRSHGNDLRGCSVENSTQTVDDLIAAPWISRLLASLVDRMFPLVPRGLLKGPSLRFHQGRRSPGAQPEIASKAVREEIEDRLHGQAADHRCSGRARRQVARDASFSSETHSPHPRLDGLRTVVGMANTPD